MAAVSVTLMGQERSKSGQDGLSKNPMCQTVTFCKILARPVRVIDLNGKF